METPEEYIKRKKIRELFQSLTLGLLSHRPDDPHRFLLDCLNTLERKESADDHEPNQETLVYLDAFIPNNFRPSSSSRTSSAPLEPIQRRDSVGLVNGFEKTTAVLTSPDSPLNYNTELSANAGRLNDSKASRQALATNGAENMSSNAASQLPESSRLSQHLIVNDTATHVQGTDQNMAQMKLDDNPQRSVATDNRSLNVHEGLTVDSTNNEIKSINDLQVTTDVDSDILPAVATEVYSSAENHAELLSRIMDGAVLNLPPRRSNIVRIFLSSTFSDFKAERNVLPRLAYPVLQQYCLRRQLDFQVVDLRWGVTDEVINDHQVSELCLREIATCQKVSMGPNFVTLIGDRYGYRPFPYSIAALEFNTLLGHVDGPKDAYGVAIVRDWYRIDTNSRRPRFLLQPIASKLKFYNAMEPEFTAEREKDLQTWDDLSHAIQAVLRKGAERALERGHLSKEVTDKYFISVTEDEIVHGIFRPSVFSAVPSRKNIPRALCFLRTFEGLPTTTSCTSPSSTPSSVASSTPGKPSCLSKFMDVTADGQIDADARVLLDRLKNQLRSHLGSFDLVREYKGAWENIPLEEAMWESKGEFSTHVKKYLKTFCEDFVSQIKRSIDDNIVDDRANFPSTAIRDVYYEVLHHASLAATKNRLFCGREDTLGRIKTYFERKSLRRKSMVIFGESGSGKTSIMAAVAHHVTEWLAPAKPVVCLRFLGTSPESSDILLETRSVLRQICFAYDFPIPSAYEALEKLRDCWKLLSELLVKISEEYPNRPLVMLMDSTDQLSMRFSAHRMSWVPRQFPHNVYMVLSMLSDRSNCLEFMKTRNTDIANYVEITPLSNDAVHKFIDSFLVSYRRALTPAQSAVIHDAVSKCQQPLFLKLVLDQAITWASYHNISSTPSPSSSPCSLSRASPDQSPLPTSIHEAIIRLFESVEMKFGQRFISHAFSYLTCGKDGLTTLEMEDALSCDDEVLNEVYKYHDPPMDGTIRLPSLMWARVSEQMQEYLIERQSDGKVVLAWYHRQFLETATERYLSCPEKKKCYHKQLAELFDQDTGIQRSITLHQRGGKTIVDADRKVCPQPLTTTNHRKLHCQPYHLLYAGEKERLKERCLLNFTWLETYLKAFGVNCGLNDYKGMCESHELFADSALHLVWDLFQICYDSFGYDSALFAYHVAVRMPPDSSDPLIRKMTADAARCLNEDTNVTRLLPTHSMRFPKLSSPLTFTLTVGQDSVMSEDENYCVCRWTDRTNSTNKLQVFSLCTMEILSTVSMTKLSPIAITRDNMLIIYIDEATVKMCDMYTGEQVRSFPYCQADEYKHITARCIATGINRKYLAIGVRRCQPSASLSRTYSTTDTQTVKSRSGSEGTFNRNILAKPATHSFIVVFDATKPIVCLENIEIKGKKSVDSLCFVDNDSRLIATFRDRIIVFQIPGLVILHQFTQVQSLHGLMTLTPVQDKSLIIVGETLHSGETRLVLFNFIDYSVQRSPSVSQTANNEDDPNVTRIDNKSIIIDGNEYVEGFKLYDAKHNHADDASTEKDGARPFGITFKPDMSLIVFATALRTKYARGGSIWMWNRTGDQVTDAESANMERIIIGAGSWKFPTAMLVIDNWNAAVVGYINGDVGVVSLVLRKELLSFHAHGNAINVLRLCCRDQFIMSQADDHNLKLWCTRRLLDKATRGQGSTTANETDEKCGVFNPEEQCVDLTTFGPYMVSASHLNVQGPKFYHLSSGLLEEELTEAFDAAYKRLWEAHLLRLGITTPFVFRTHATIQSIGEYLVYCRKLRDKMALFITKGLQHSPVNVVGHEFFADTFFDLVVAAPDSNLYSKFDDDKKTGESGIARGVREMVETATGEGVVGGGLRIFLVRDGCVEIRNERLELLHSMPATSIKEDIPNMTTSNGKKRLMNYKVAITTDQRYFLIINPSPGKSGKYFDVFDLKSNTLTMRVSLSPETMWKVLADGVYYLVHKPKPARLAEIENIVDEDVENESASNDQEADEAVDKKEETPFVPCIAHIDGIKNCCCNECTNLVQDALISENQVSQGRNDLQGPVSILRPEKQREKLSKAEKKQRKEMEQKKKKMKRVEVFELCRVKGKKVERKTSSDADSNDCATDDESYYKCKLRTHVNMMSADGKVSACLKAENVIKVYRETPPLTLKLHGHTAEVTSIAISSDNRLLTSGSLDNTVRLWSLTTGKQLALFYTYWTVENVKFDETGLYVVAHCVGAPQKKRGVILKIMNLKPEEDDDLEMKDEDVGLSQQKLQNVLGYPKNSSESLRQGGDSIINVISAFL